MKEVESRKDRDRKDVNRVKIWNFKKISRTKKVS